MCITAKKGNVKSGGDKKKLVLEEITEYKLQRELQNSEDNDLQDVEGMKRVCLFICLFIWGFTSLSTLYRSYHDG